MTTLKPWEQSRTTYSFTGNSTIMRDSPVNQITITPNDNKEEVKPEEEVKLEEIKKSKTK